MTVLELLDNFLRFGAIACCLMTAALVLRDARNRISAKLSAFCCITTSSYLASSIPGLGETIGFWMLPILAVCLFGPTALWLFSLSMFEDDFKLKRFHYIVVGVFAALCVIQYALYWTFLDQPPLISPTKLHAELRGVHWLSTIISWAALLMKVAMSFHMLYSAWKGKDDDLVEARRKFRETFVMASAFISFGIVITEKWLLGFGHSTGAILLLGQSASIMAVVIYMMWHVGGIDGNWLFGEPETSPVPEKPRRPLSADRHDLETLDALVTEGVLLEAGLTISRLADMASMPEHRLRRLINEHLDFRNFADYLNYHRIEAAKDRLAVIKDRHVPVLTVAMDLGYGSLGPFNRAFKERAGMTPSEFRKKALADC
ncbi:AraC family transcriptional regulator [Kordiimonas sp. SCSIO 12603]|uniref:helix-turn-helix domain-containing protein n=1 Tax=Kordiimonas sp. SCSIO 12603 TaxID=2829596 RepID=UPI00210578B4|nr:helix-turn-helix domain-containing protein [Kordiimonas sp. SCSIO 12603]UTW60145.1 AraC family transcriptional regulator [Kordiimonas sp. SCSIO 12603]